uniref:Translation initiation factor IF-2 n=2 Tax=Lygus hesperus TaxID=30085 RepID=A0A0A9WLE6_LYGHE
MVLDCIEAHNRYWPDSRISVERRAVGLLTPTDILVAKELQCDIFVFRGLRKVSASLRTRAQQAGVQVYEYHVFDDLFKSILTTERYHLLLSPTSTLSVRPYSDPTLGFVEPPPTPLLTPNRLQTAPLLDSSYDETVPGGTCVNSSGTNN